MIELSGLLEEATAALSKLDADSLERLNERATALVAEALLPERPVTDHLAEVQAKFRVFARVLTATGENLQALTRSRLPGRYGIQMAGPVTFDRVEFQGQEAAGLSCTWPRGRVAQARALRERTGRL